MPEEPLSYEKMLAELLGLIGQEVFVAIDMRFDRQRRPLASLYELKRGKGDISRSRESRSVTRPERRFCSTWAMPTSSCARTTSSAVVVKMGFSVPKLAGLDSSWVARSATRPVALRSAAT
jgi:hypothetical protein